MIEQFDYKYKGQSMLSNWKAQDLCSSHIFHGILIIFEIIIFYINELTFTEIAMSKVNANIFANGTLEFKTLWGILGIKDKTYGTI